MNGLTYHVTRGSFTVPYDDGMRFDKESIIRMYRDGQKTSKTIIRVSDHKTLRDAMSKLDEMKPVTLITNGTLLCVLFYVEHYNSPVEYSVAEIKN